MTGAPSPATQTRLRDVFGVKDLFTLGNLGAGLAAFVLAARGEVRWAAAAIFIGYVCDALDGLVARLMRSGNRFGAEFDNVADLATYSIAPAFVIHAFYEPFNEVAALLLAACPVLSGALRFARFNVQRIELPGYWVGLPRPGSAVLIASYCAAGVAWGPAMAWAGLAFIPLVCAMNLMLMPFHGHHRRAATRPVVLAIVLWLASTAIATALGYVWEVCLFWSAAYTFAQGLFIPAADRAQFRAFVAAWREGQAARHPGGGAVAEPRALAQDGTR